MCVKDSKQLKPQRQQIHHSQPPASDQHQDAAQPRVIEAGPIESVINMFQINHVHLQMDTHCLILALRSQGPLRFHTLRHTQWAVA